MYRNRSRNSTRSDWESSSRAWAWSQQTKKSVPGGKPTINEVRGLYYGILQAESGKQGLQATVSSLPQLDRDTDDGVLPAGFFASGCA